MPTSVSRRDVLKQLGTAGAGVILAQGVIRGQQADILVAGQPVEIVVTALSADLIRLTVLPLDGGRPGAVPVDGALVRETPGKALAHARRSETFTPVAAGHLVVKFTADPPTLVVETKAGKPVQRLTLDAQQPGARFLLSQGPLLGMGQGSPQFDRKGNADIMRNGQGGYKLHTFGARVPIQWLVGTGAAGTESWGMFIHHPLGTFDLTGAEGTFTPGIVVGNRDEGGGTGNRIPGPPLPLDVFVTASSDPVTIMKAYADITGLPELPARWTLGYMQSTRTLEGPEKILEIPRTFREKKLPLDAMIYLGTEFTPSGWNTRNGEFGFNKNNFPDPKQMIDAHHALHAKIVLHIVIEGRRMSGSALPPCDPKHAVPSGRTPDDKWPADRDVACYWPYHKPLFDLGVDGWWPDQGDGLDAPSRLARNRMYWEGSQIYRPNERPFALHRNGYAGMQRFAAFLWSGDTYSQWETLHHHVPIAINTGLSGIPYWGSDIGGFVPTPELTGELFVRWFQFGAFCPSFRAHGRTWHLRLPWGWNTGEFGPEEVKSYTGGAGHPDPSELHNAQVEPICRKYLELRYRLLPYIYSAARETHETGLPLMRALWLHHPDDPVAVARGDQFLWGRDLLVAPVTEKGQTTKKVYLPKGTWLDFWTEQPVDGGKEIDRPVDLETTPLYARAGAIIPFGPLKQYTDEPVDGPLTLVIYPGADGTATIYEDDGKTFEHRKGAFTKLAATWKDATRQLTITLVPGTRLLTPGPRTIDVRLAGRKDIHPTTFTGKPVTLKL